MFNGVVDEIQTHPKGVTDLRAITTLLLPYGGTGEYRTQPSHALQAYANPSQLPSHIWSM
jgi:hypothetical protein